LVGVDFVDCPPGCQKPQQFGHDDVMLYFWHDWMKAFLKIFRWTWRLSQQSPSQAVIYRCWASLEQFVDWDLGAAERGDLRSSGRCLCRLLARPLVCLCLTASSRC
jgi:hypothetical protein